MERDAPAGILLSIYGVVVDDIPNQAPAMGSNPANQTAFFVPVTVSAGDGNKYDRHNNHIGVNGSLCHGLPDQQRNAHYRDVL